MSYSPNSLTAIRWPVDICVFSLAFGYGIAQILDRLFNGSPPDSISVSTYVVISFFSASVVGRYLPSQEDLEHLKPSVFRCWTSISMLLSTGIPAIAVLHSDTAFFMFLLVGSVAAKAIVEMEDRFTKEPRPPTHDRHWLFKSRPNAYALRPIPSAALLTGLPAGLVCAIQFDNWNWFYWLSFGSLAFYLILSTMGRCRAMRETVKRKDSVF